MDLTITMIESGIQKLVRDWYLVLLGLALTLGLIANVMPELRRTLVDMMESLSRRKPRKSRRVSMGGRNGWLTENEYSDFVEWSGLEEAGQAGERTTLIATDEEGQELARVDTQEFYEKFRRA